MPVVNATSAIIARLRSIASVTSLVGGASPRISGALQNSWNLKNEAAIVVYGPRGGPGGSIPIPGHWAERLDIYCYATNGKDAKDLAQTVIDALIPLQGTRSSFTAAHTRVINVQEETGKIALTDPQTGWDFCVVPIVATYNRTYVP